MTLLENMTRCTWLVHYHYRKRGFRLVVIIVNINFGFGMIWYDDIRLISSVIAIILIIIS